jgi:hypothetical protein
MIMPDPPRIEMAFPAPEIDPALTPVRPLMMLPAP